jgi:hypothetical protein
MTLRIMLLGVVASMGFELPSGSDISCWANSAQRWVDATKSDQSRHCVEAEKADVLPSNCLLTSTESCRAPMAVEPTKACDDEPFDAVSHAMAADFVADLLVKGPKPEALEPQPLIVEILEVPATGLPSGEEVAIVEITAEKVEVAQVSEDLSVIEDAKDVTSAMHERLDRIASAIRLTREAVQAWAEAIEPSDEAGLTR